MAKANRLILFRNIIVVARTMRNTVHTVGRVQEYWMIKQFAQIATTWLLFLRALGNTRVFAFEPFS